MSNTSHKWSIPTTYNGIKFRSKLEASYAKWFDELGITWDYEPEGFDIDGVKYLPDFWLPDIKTVVEVKGILDQADVNKINKLYGKLIGNNILFVLAESPLGRFKIVTPSLQEHYYPGCNDNTALNIYLKQGIDFSEDVFLTQCPECGKYQFLNQHGCYKCRNCGAYDRNWNERYICNHIWNK